MVPDPVGRGKPKGITKVILGDGARQRRRPYSAVRTPRDLDNVKKIQAKYKVQTLSAFFGRRRRRRTPTPAWVKPVPAGDMKTSLGLLQCAALRPAVLSGARQSRRRLRSRLARIGIVPGKTFNAACAPARDEGCASRGNDPGQKRIDARRAAAKGKVGLTFSAPASFQGTTGWRGPPAPRWESARTPGRSAVSDLRKGFGGQSLDGSKGRYTLRFAKDNFRLSTPSGR